MRFALVIAALALVAAAMPSAADTISGGQAVFVRECAKCHQVGANAKHRIGPVLNGVFGRQAGTAAGFDHYSEAIRKSGIIWTPQTFRAFIMDPHAMVNQTNQIYKGLEDEESITLLIEFLQTKN